MTVIMGATFRGGAAVGADSLRHNAMNLGHAGNTNKTVTLNCRTVAAKAGYGPDADGIWQTLRETDIDEIGPAEISRRLRGIGADVYARCLEKARALGAVDAGLYLIVAGTEKGGQPALHWLNFQLQDFGHTNEVGRALAFASRPEANVNAWNHVARLVRNTGAGATMQLDTWARNLVIDEQKYAPHAIGFPVNLRAVRADGVLDLNVFECDPEDRAAEVYMD
jgi:hypothetical protein